MPLRYILWPFALVATIAWCLRDYTTMYDGALPAFVAIRWLCLILFVFHSILVFVCCFTCAHAMLRTHARRHYLLLLLLFCYNVVVGIVTTLIICCPDIYSVIVCVLCYCWVALLVHLLCGIVTTIHCDTLHILLCYPHYIVVIVRFIYLLNSAGNILMLLPTFIHFDTFVMYIVPWYIYIVPFSWWWYYPIHIWHSQSYMLHPTHVVTLCSMNYLPVCGISGEHTHARWHLFDVLGSAHTALTVLRASCLFIVTHFTFGDFAFVIYDVLMRCTLRIVYALFVTVLLLMMITYCLYAFAVARYRRCLRHLPGIYVAWLFVILFGAMVLHRCLRLNVFIVVLVAALSMLLTAVLHYDDIVPHLFTHTVTPRYVTRRDNCCHLRYTFHLHTRVSLPIRHHARWWYAFAIYLWWRCLYGSVIRCYIDGWWCRAHCSIYLLRCYDVVHTHLRLLQYICILWLVDVYVTLYLRCHFMMLRTHCPHLLRCYASFWRDILYLWYCVCLRCTTHYWHICVTFYSMTCYCTTYIYTLTHCDYFVILLVLLHTRCYGDIYTFADWWHRVAVIYIVYAFMIVRTWYICCYSTPLLPLILPHPHFTFTYTIGDVVLLPLLLYIWWPHHLMRASWCILLLLFSPGDDAEYTVHWNCVTHYIHMPLCWRSVVTDRCWCLICISFLRCYTSITRYCCCCWYILPLPLCTAHCYFTALRPLRDD